MNYFELFEIPIQLKMNKDSLSEKFFELSRKYHPDYFVNNDSKTKAEAFEKSAILNKTFRTFQNPDEAIKMDIDDDLAVIKNLQSEIYEPVKEIVEHYQKGITSEKELLQVKEYYYKKKYLDHIRRQSAGMD